MKKADFFIIILVAILSLLPLGAMALGGGKAETVTVSVKGQTVYSGSLSKDAVIETGRNTVTIAGGHVSMTEADCPDGLCLAAGEATPYHPLVCLPNQVVVTVSGREDAVDALSY